MHPLIRAFPSDSFYEGRIEDGKNVTQRKLDAEMARLARVMRRCVFFDLCNSRESALERSRCNQDEVNFTLSLVKYIVLAATNGRGFRALAGKIGVVTPYKAQVRCLKNAFGPWIRSMNGRLEQLEVNTVDAFQGREKDIIIFNCVRSNTISSMQGSLGFLTDLRRLNVAITRPRHFIFVVGNSKTLVQHEVWASLVKSCQARSREGGYFRLDQQVEQYSDKVIGQIVSQQSDSRARQAELQQVEQSKESEEDRQVQSLLERAKRARSTDLQEYGDTEPQKRARLI